MRPYLCIIFFQLVQIIGNSNQPSERSFVSLLEEGNLDNDPEETEASSSGDGEEERTQSHSQQRILTKDKKQNPTSTTPVDPNNDGTEGKEASISGGDISSPEAKVPPLSRCHSEHTAMTPKTKRKLQKSYSEMPPMPLKSGIKTNILQ